MPIPAFKAPSRQASLFDVSKMPKFLNWVSCANFESQTMSPCWRSIFNPTILTQWNLENMDQMTTGRVLHEPAFTMGVSPKKHSSMMPISNPSMLIWFTNHTPKFVHRCCGGQSSWHQLQATLGEEKQATRVAPANWQFHVDTWMNHWKS